MRFTTRVIVFGYPLAEILVLWGVASVIGWGWALLGIVAGIPIGFALMRNAGSSAQALFAASAQGDEQQARVLASSMTGQFVAGALIAIPGYLTDVFGLVLLLPGARNAIGRLAMRRASPWMARMPGAGPIIQGTVVVEDLRYSTDAQPDGRDEPPAITG